MSSSNGSPHDELRSKKITLPPLRDILGEELASSPRPPSRSSGAAFSLDPMRTALSADSSPQSRISSRMSSASPEAHYTSMHQNRERPWDAPSSNIKSSEYLTGMRPTAVEGSTPPYMSRSSSAFPRPFTTPSPDFPARRALHSETLLRRSSSAMPMSSSRAYTHAEMQRPKSNSHSGVLPASGAQNDPRALKRTRDPQTPTLISNVDWRNHRRRDSTDSVRSSNSSSSNTSSHVHSSLSPPNALQFQPLPHSHLNPTPPYYSNAPPHSHYSSAAQAATGFHSPFGVLIADADVSGVPHTDPQRMAILRTLRASNMTASYPPNAEDYRNIVPTARYECPYCYKRFSRPSSLKIHINSHTGEKPFQCTHPGCGRRFSVQSNMRRHARVHQPGSCKLAESSGDEVGDEDSSQSRTSPSIPPESRPELPRLDVEMSGAFSDSEDSASTHSRTAHPSSETPQLIRGGPVLDSRRPPQAGREIGKSFGQRK